MYLNAVCWDVLQYCQYESMKNVLINKCTNKKFIKTFYLTIMYFPTYTKLRAYVS